MIVVGGVYSEYCYYPSSHQVFGSGGRAAAVLKKLGCDDVTLITCAPDSERLAIGAALAPYDFDFQIVPSSDLYEFSYTHPLSDPYLAPFPITPAKFGDTVFGATVLVFGMLEGTPTIEAERIIFDPQSETDLASPTKFIKDRDELAFVLNERELRIFTSNPDIRDASRHLVRTGQATAVVVKRGPFGCLVTDKDGCRDVPVYPTDRVFKIGSGDVFSAAFAKFWANDSLSTFEAATRASRCTSLYCETKSVDAVVEFSEFHRYPREKKKEPLIYLAGPFFTLSQRFLIEEARRALLNLNVSVFSPMHDVGFELPHKTIAKEDLKGLDGSTAVLALIEGFDPGTLFEIGYARSKMIPVVTYGENILADDLLMLEGSDCLHSDDFCSAIYNAVWAGM